LEPNDSSATPLRRVNGKPWQPGESGNLYGRPVGARSKFSQQFVADLSDAWQQYGADALAQTAKLYPDRFVGICSHLIPKDVALTRCGSPHPPDTGVDELSLVLDISPEGSAAPALKLGSVDNCDYADGDGGDQQDFHGDGLISAELRRRKMWN